MTPKEFNFMFEMLERVASLAYAKGYDDAEGKKTKDDQAFTLNKEHRLRIKSELNKYLKNA